MARTGYVNAPAGIALAIELVVEGVDDIVQSANPTPGSDDPTGYTWTIGVGVAANVYKINLKVGGTYLGYDHIVIGATDGVTYKAASAAAVQAKTDNLPATPAAVGSAMTLTSGERIAIANAHLDLTDGIESGLTPRQAQRLEVAAAAGKLSGAGGETVTVRNAVADSKARITATVDASGNRTAVTTDVT